MDQRLPRVSKPLTAGPSGGAATIDCGPISPQSSPPRGGGRLVDPSLVSRMLRISLTQFDRTIDSSLFINVSQLSFPLQHSNSFSRSASPMQRALSYDLFERGEIVRHFIFLIGFDGLGATRPELASTLTSMC